MAIFGLSVVDENGLDFWEGTVAAWFSFRLMIQVIIQEARKSGLEKSFINLEI